MDNNCSIIIKKFCKKRSLIFFVIYAGIFLMFTGIIINSFFTYWEKFTLSPGESIKVASTIISLNDFVILRNPDRSEK